MDARIDQMKYQAGCRTLENFIPLIYGGASRRPGLEYIAAQKTASAKGRVVAFEHSVDDTYILLFENQVIRVFRAGGQIVDGVGTEDVSGVDGGALIAHWLLNEIEAVTVVNDDNPGTYDGTATVACSTFTATGKVGTGCFDLDGQYAVSIGDAAAFSFTNNTIDSAFSIACWAYVTQQNDVQVLLSKWRNSSTTREWRFSLNNERKLQLHLCDSASDLTGNIISHYKLNDNAASTAVDDDIELQDGVCTVNTNTLSATGKVGLCLDFGGTAAVQINDQATYSFGNGTADSAFSIAAWVYVTAGTGTRRILSKYDLTTGSELREWSLSLTHLEYINFKLYDESANASQSKQTARTVSTGWHFVVATYDGTGGDDATDGMTLYIDNVVVDQTASDVGTYVAMENTATKVIIGGGTEAGGSVGDFWDDKIDNVMLFDIELSVAQVETLWNDGDGTETLAGVSPTAYTVSDDAISVGWHYLACTYSAVHSIASDGGSAADDIILYVDSSAVDSTATNDADYDAMVNGDEEVRIGSQYNLADDGNEKYWGDKIDEMSIFSDVLTPTEVASLYSTTPFEITTPYLTADLPYLKFERSADVMYITHPDYEPRKLSRTGHTVWALEETDLQDGPFRSQNTDTSFTITPSATTGSITLTAAGTGNNPFVMGTTIGHSPSGFAETSKSVTGALFKIVHGEADASITDDLDMTDVAAPYDLTTHLIVYKGVTWDFTTKGTWGGTVVLERSYDDGTTYETVFTVSSSNNKNSTTYGTEEFNDARYRVRVTVPDAGSTEVCAIQLSVRDADHIGIVEITSVASSTSATATVLTTLGDTSATHRWSEGSWSNYRGWPIAVSISPEERLTFAGSSAQPLTLWGSVIGDYTSMKIGDLDDDAIIFTLVGSGKQNTIRWMLPKTALMIGTVGGEHLFGATDDKEPVTPTNVNAKLQGTRGSEDIQAIIVNQAIIFVQRGGRKIREILYDYIQDVHKSDDLTVFSNHITESGIVDMAFQRTPDPTLWCVRDDGELAAMTYEKDQDVFSWYRTTTGTSDEFESVAVIYGGAGEEDEVWVTVKRTINTATTPTIVRHVERFYQRAMPADMDDMKYVDSFLTYDSTAASTITGLDHLEGETVQVLADGIVFDEAIVSSNQITLKLDTVTTTASTVQIGKGYSSTLKPMKLDIASLGLATTKKINRAIINLFETIKGEMGTTTSNLKDIATGTSALFSGHKEMSLPGGYSRIGDIIVRQTDPLPMTVLSLTLDVGAAND